MCDSNGVCSCKPNFMNVKCDQCNIGFFNFPLCEGNQCINSTLIKLELIFSFKACDCNEHGSNGTSCDDNGICSCKANFMGNKCDTCKTGFYSFPTCQGMQNQYIPIKSDVNFDFLF